MSDAFREITTGSKWLLFKGSHLTIGKILRQLPGRRTACFADLNGKQVFCKIFQGKYFQRDGEREKEGILTLQSGGILTATLIDHQVDMATQQVVLIFESLEGAVTLQKMLNESCSEGQIEQFLSMVTETIALMHRQGIEQVDIHSENFLFFNSACYTVDGALIDGYSHKKGRPVDSVRAIKNLAMFFAQLPPAMDGCIEGLLNKYISARELPVGEVPLTILTEKILELRKWRERKYVKNKSLRNCSEFLCKRKLKRFAVFDRQLYGEKFEVLWEDPESVLESGRLVKSGRSAEVRLIELGGKKYVIKKYHFKNYIHCFFRSFLPTRAEISWRNGVLLRFLSIPTPRPVALVENRFGPFRGESYIVTEWIDGEHAWAWFVEGERSSESLDQTVGKVTIILNSLRRTWISHGDLKATNLIISNGEPFLIDLDAMVSWRHRVGFEKQFNKDLSHFLGSWRGQERILDLLKRSFAAAGLLR
jgi:tRNA A-37 threonylcarbamoyl transferase component Bud32